MSDAVWLRSERDPVSGAYITVLEASDDHARTLTPEEGIRYVAAVMEAAHRAAYDAGILAQLTKRLKLDDTAAGLLINQLRADRPPLDDKATAPLSFEPGVALRNRKPFLKLLIDGEPAGQWTVRQAARHAMAVLEITTVADLDAAYHRALTGLVGVDEGTADNVVGDIGKHRDKVL